MMVYLNVEENSKSLCCLAGSEIYQETLIKGLAHLLQVNILVFDSTRVYLEVQYSSLFNVKHIISGCSLNS